MLVSLCADAMWGHQPLAVVENLVVDAHARRQRIGACLLQTAEAFCTAADCSKPKLPSAFTREQAHFFIEHSGYAGSAKRGLIKYRRDFRVACSAG